ncbi:hypothetical protein CGLO_17532 [Colletotrichum gloeosporioides Cg-14]|uniref:Uncharacterized protein n=1 Tax=Colletotrichum gloeosporioides (strain Cg-14) TaxID=1237896 RepID=T0KWN1_COLGC|nr:hypothetical protein CGLO_17532 [Colletotrichum gloeosporioides Cg-14]
MGLMARSSISSRSDLLSCLSQ